MLISTKGRYALRVMIDLAEHQSRHTDIRNLQKLLLLHPAIYPQRNKSRNHRAINGQSAFARVKDTEQIVLIKIPTEDDIVNPRSDNGKNNRIDRKIPNQIRIQLLFLRNVRRQQDSTKNTQADDHTIESDTKPEDAKTPRHIP